MPSVRRGGDADSADIVRQYGAVVGVLRAARLPVRAARPSGVYEVYQRYAPIDAAVRLDGADDVGRHRRSCRSSSTSHSSGSSGRPNCACASPRRSCMETNRRLEESLRELESHTVGHAAGARRRRRREGQLHGESLARRRGLRAGDRPQARPGDDDLVLLEKASLLHDIGKIGVPERILLKTSQLTPEERHLVGAARGTGRPDGRVRAVPRRRRAGHQAPPRALGRRRLSRTPGRRSASRCSRVSSPSRTPTTR